MVLDDGAAHLLGRYELDVGGGVDLHGRTIVVDEGLLQGGGMIEGAVVMLDATLLRLRKPRAVACCEFGEKLGVNLPMIDVGHTYLMLHLLAVETSATRTIAEDVFVVRRRTE